MGEASVIGRKLEGVMERSGLLSKDGARRSPPASYLNKYMNKLVTKNNMSEEMITIKFKSKVI